MFNDNITAISSGNINQAISIIRICGPDAIEILKKIYTGKIGTDKTITYGWIVDKDKTKIDEVLVNFFIGKNNYIGEDTVEINAHGGVVVTNKILNLILANGARLAERGEFTRRAFLNGRLSLEKAEAINALIHAKTNKQAKIAITQFEPEINQLINSLENELLQIISLVEINIDYSDYNDIEQMDKNKLNKLLDNFQKRIKVVVEKSENASDIYRGINIAIVGKPNTGKSSLLNALIQKDKAIVTDIPGTTRDLVEAEFEINGILFRIIDTAGIRKTDNEIESIGIKKSLEAIDNAKVIIHLHDPLQKDSTEDEQIKKLAKDKIYINVLNKRDLIKNLPEDMVCISAKDNNLYELRNALVKKYNDIDLDDKEVLYNTRQLSLLKQVEYNINDALEGLGQGFGPEVVILDLTKAWENLRSILNKSHDNEALLDNIFSKFCLGK
ncbi:tRNA uridine-5-carboxymethylaminomethyl(34) synthesis GTPase MnmE [Metamycoplasma arthritidis]|uniref:tRNA modification GTPase MnmE n=1 Tax=Metamycoplasma arthritidis (strain 158L3-1) TaxID=243272 RepID=B3PNA1_META1|nr:tRNA uridine-5-carboxymethylaminomethyl(34) synthesis GTPase MnmE [Metamycoplasma arthritidis]ACF07503.1 tRNA modification GTPase TrmE [Metamycoplasma arthritidis 158L3-1]